MKSKMSQKEVRVRVQAAMEQCRFPPRVILPEDGLDVPLLSELFARPLVVWIPEVLNPLRKPYCVNEGCSCTPTVKEYCSRLVEDVYHTTELLYVRYECGGATKTSFTTVSDQYLQRSTRLQLQFPYILTHKFGIAVTMMDQVHDAMLTGSGMLGLETSLLRRRQNRYYQLLSLFAILARERTEKDDTFIVPTPVTVTSYMEEHAPPTRESLTDIWMERTNLVSSLSEGLRRNIVVKRILRMDHTAKFPKRLFDHKAGGAQENLADLRLLLLVLNEAGQVVGHTFTRSENNEETDAELRKILDTCKFQPQSSGSSGAICIVSDNVNAVRRMVDGLDHTPVQFELKQDPFHVIQRFTSKIKGGASKGLGKELREALYTHQGELHDPSTMHAKVAAAAERVDAKNISCPPAKWSGTIANNLRQIQSGDLHIDSNWYSEGGQRVKVVSTSQVEGFNSALKRLLNRNVSLAVGSRILDHYILQHNLTAGARFLRSPDFGKADLLTVCRSALLCENVVASSPHQEFALRLLPTRDTINTRRNPTVHDFDFITWSSMYPSIPIDADAAKNKLHAQRNYRASIKEMLLNQATTIRGSKMRRVEFFRCLNLTPSDAEAARPFSAQELELLRQIRSEQLAAPETAKWRECTVVSTILFNAVVTRLNDARSSLSRRSFQAIDAQVAWLRQRKGQAKSEDASVSTAPEAITSTAPSAPSIFTFIHDAIVTEVITPHERAFALELFSAIRATSWTKKKLKFCSLFDFGAHLCADVTRKSGDTMEKLWGSLKRAENRDRQRVIASSTVIRFTNVSAHLSSGVVDAFDHGLRIANEAQIDVRDDMGVASDGVNAVAAAGLAAVEDSASQNGDASVAGELATTPDVMHRVAAYAATIPPHTQGRWDMIHKKLRELAPHSELNRNALKCRLTRLREKELPPKQSLVAPQIVDPPSIPTKLVCESCRKRKRKCGDASRNPSCKRLRAVSSSIESFLSTC